jgi:nitrogen regulatory protein PII
MTVSSPMKMLMLIARTERREELEIFLRQEGLRGFTEISDVHGSGSSGPRMGSAVAPATSSVIFAMVSEPRLQEIIAKLSAFCAECHEHLKIAHWDIVVEEVGLGHAE